MSVAVESNPVAVRFVVGCASLPEHEAARVAGGDVVELDGGDAVEVFAGDRLIARGEAVMLDRRWGVRITELR